MVNKKAVLYALVVILGVIFGILLGMYVFDRDQFYKTVPFVTDKVVSKEADNDIDSTEKETSDLEQTEQIVKDVQELEEELDVVDQNLNDLQK